VVTGRNRVESQKRFSSRMVSHGFCIPAGDTCSIGDEIIETDGLAVGYFERTLSSDPEGYSTGARWTPRPGRN